MLDLKAQYPNQSAPMFPWTVITLTLYLLQACSHTAFALPSPIRFASAFPFRI